MGVGANGPLFYDILAQMKHTKVIPEKVKNHTFEQVFLNLRGN